MPALPLSSSACDHVVGGRGWFALATTVTVQVMTALPSALINLHLTSNSTHSMHVRVDISVVLPGALNDRLYCLLHGPCLLYVFLLRQVLNHPLHHVLLTLLLLPVGRVQVQHHRCVAVPQLSLVDHGRAGPQLGGEVLHLRVELQVELTGAPATTGRQGKGRGTSEASEAKASMMNTRRKGVHSREEDGETSG